MSRGPQVSIVISSFNYGRFLAGAIDSALAQAYPHTEVIVVDDGSTDDSRAVIARYGSRILPVLKNNGGQGSALNAGFAASRGEVVLFLDSDDLLLPTAAERAVEALREPGAAKVHCPMRVIDEAGKETGRIVPGGELAEGNLLDLVLREGPDSYGWSPTSGNAWSRRYLSQVLPMPEQAYRTCPDLHLTAWVAFFGSVRRVIDPQSLWRVHGGNNSWSSPFDERLAAHVSRWEFAFAGLERHARDRGLPVDLEAWRRASWFHRIDRAVRDIASVVPPGGTFILADEDWWETGDIVAGRRRCPFLERDGQYWGAPADDTEAIRELRRLRDRGATFVAFAWPTFWWLDHYVGLQVELEACYRCLHRDDRVVVFGPSEERALVDVR